MWICFNPVSLGTVYQKILDESSSSHFALIQIATDFRRFLFSSYYSIFIYSLFHNKYKEVTRIPVSACVCVCLGVCVCVSVCMYVSDYMPVYVSLWLCVFRCMCACAPMWNKWPIYGLFTIFQYYGFKILWFYRLTHTRHECYGYHEFHENFVCFRFGCISFKIRRCIGFFGPRKVSGADPNGKR